MASKRPSPISVTSGCEGRSGPRSRNGCWTCRTKKVKCDEERPHCRRCLRLRLLCDYTPRKKQTRLKGQRMRGLSACSDVETYTAADGRASGPKSPDQPQASVSATGEWFQSLLMQDEARSISTFRIPVLTASTSSLTLTAMDHEAIRYFRTTFATSHHTKNPEYSLYSIMFKIAEVNPVVMHMVLALGGREMAFRRSRLEYGRQEDNSPMDHYSTALGLMANLIGDGNVNKLELDSVHTALYLMILYEQKFGDDTCAGIINHLNGAALLLKHLYRRQGDGSSPRSARVGTYSSAISPHLSLYAARLVLYIIDFDASAAFYGVGGQVNVALYKLLCTNSESDVDFSDVEAESNTVCGQTWAEREIITMEEFQKLHRYSEPLYRVTWGKEYPQSEVLDDVENSSVFLFEGTCVRLRFMLAQLADIQLQDSESDRAQKYSASLDICFEYVGEKYSELIDVAAHLSPSTDSSRRLVANLRRVIPKYHALFLYHLRLRSNLDHADLSMRQVEALRQIMNLASQAYKHDGDKAMVGIAWPLLIVAVETNDHLHREWVLDRFKALCEFGHHFERAHRFLVDMAGLLDKASAPVDLRGRLQSGDFGLFVI